LADHDRHHLERALRLRDGDPLTLSDGHGSWRTARFGDHIESTGSVVDVVPAIRPVAIAAALTKSGKPELVVQKVTELGVDRVVLFAADRSVPDWDDNKRQRALDRLGRVAREAAMQSRRVYVPSVEFVDDLSSLIESTPADGVARADFTDGAKPIDDAMHMIAVGPEGGWSDREREMMPSAIDLGPTVLRAETAAIVAAARLVERR